MTDPSQTPSSALSVLVVEDDPFVRELVETELRQAGLRVTGAEDGRTALDVMATNTPDAVVLDLGLPDVDGTDLLQQIREQWPHVQAVVATAQEDVQTAVICTRAGAVDYLVKPFEPLRLATSARNAAERGRLEREVSDLRSRLETASGFRSFLGSSRAIETPLKLLKRAAQSDVNVLIEGESGTGKEVAARALHEDGERGSGPFIAINCGAIPSSLMESELFGHTKGSFTGATSDRAGCFEEANGGTLFLDEVGELPQEVQVRLLRVLQERTIQRIGSANAIPVDVRIVAATNRDLRTEVAEGRFREDLYYRLAVFPVQLPPLREREGDALMLAHAFLDSIPGAPEGFSSYATRAMLAYDWPGNVRELRNAMERASVLEDGLVVGLSSLPPEVTQAGFPDGLPDAEAREAIERSESQAEASAAPVTGGAPAANAGPALFPQDEVLAWEEYERRIIENALRVNDWRIKDTLAALGIGRATLYRKIERFGLERPAR